MKLVLHSRSSTLGSIFGTIPGSILAGTIVATTTVGILASTTAAQLDLPTLETDFDGGGFWTLSTCNTNEVKISTGYNHRGTAFGRPTLPVSSLHSPVPDEAWRIVHDPFLYTHEPRPARTVIRHPSWAAPLPDSVWIGSRDTADEAWAFGATDYFIFETRFCTRTAANLVLDITVRADDVVDFFLNPPSVDDLVVAGIPASLGPFHIGSHTGGASGAATPISGFLNATTGENRLLARVRRTSGTPLGLNVAGRVLDTTGQARLIAPHCCLGNSIIGRKLDDWQFDFTNVNNRDVPMRGIPIRLVRTSPTLPSYSAITLTDIHGDFAFLDLPGGTFRIEELEYLPCFQTVPAAPDPLVYTVSFDGPGMFSSGPRAASLNRMAVPSQVQFGDEGFGNWCDTCAWLGAHNSDLPPTLDCHLFQMPGDPIWSMGPTYFLSYGNDTTCTIHRVKVEVLFPNTVTVVPAVINLTTPLLPNSGTNLPAIRLNASESDVGEPVCLRLTFYTVIAGVELECCVQDLCDWVPCESLSGGHE